MDFRMAKVSAGGKLGKFLLVNGRKENCMGKENSGGRMEGSMLGNMIWILNMGMESFTGLTENTTKVAGQKASSMAKESSPGSTKRKTS